MSSALKRIAATYGDPYGNDITAVKIPTTGFAAIGPVGGSLPSNADLADPGFTLPEDYAYLGLFTQDGGPAEGNEAGDMLAFFQIGYELPSGDDDITETLKLAEDNEAVRRLVYGDDATVDGVVYAKAGAVPVGSFPYLRVTRYRNGTEMRRAGMVHVQSIEPEQETRGEVRAFAVTFAFDVRQVAADREAYLRDAYVDLNAPTPAPPMPIVATPDAVTVVGDSSTLQQLSTLTVDGVPWEPAEAPVLTVNGTTCPMETEPGIRVWYWPAVPDDLGPDDKLVQFAMQDSEPGVLSAIVDEGIEAVLTVVVADAAGTYEPATVTVTVERLQLVPSVETLTLPAHESGNLAITVNDETFREFRYAVNGTQAPEQLNWSYPDSSDPALTFQRSVYGSPLGVTGGKPGTYTLEFSDPFGRYSPCTVTVVVTPAPLVVVPGTKTLAPGAWLKLAVTLDGEPVPGSALTATVDPAGAVTFGLDISDPTITAPDNGDGTATVTLEYVDADNVRHTGSIEIEVDPSLPNIGFLQPIADPQQLIIGDPSAGRWQATFTDPQGAGTLATGTVTARENPLGYVALETWQLSPDYPMWLGAVTALSPGSTTVRFVCDDGIDGGAVYSTVPLHFECIAAQ